jgi:hypothetical protein
LPRGKRAAERKLLRLAMLFFGDDKRAAEAALRDLRFSNHDIAWVARLAEARARLGDAVDTAMLRVDGPTDAELRRWSAEVGRTAAASWWRLNAALWCARKSAPTASKVASVYRRLLRTAYRDAIEIGDLQVDGEDLAAAGVPKGPQLGATLKRLLQAVIERPSLNTRDQLLALAREGSEERA